MTTTTAPAPKTCECGCGATVARSFLPGHDAKLKSALVGQVKAPQWWIREAAAHKLVGRGWGHFVDTELLSSIPVRSRHAGRFVETRHLQSLKVFVVDQAGDVHSHKSCPRIVGGRDNARISDRHEGWACGTCIHTEELVELAWAMRAYVWALQHSGLTAEDLEGE